MGIRSQVTVKLYILWIGKAQKTADKVTEKILQKFVPLSVKTD